jgi:hypothetical protein
MCWICRNVLMSTEMLVLCTNNPDGDLLLHHLLGIASRENWFITTTIIIIIIINSFRRIEPACSSSSSSQNTRILQQATQWPLYDIGSYRLNSVTCRITTNIVGRRRRRSIGGCCGRLHSHQSFNIFAQSVDSK